MFLFRFIVFVCILGLGCGFGKFWLIFLVFCFLRFYVGFIFGGKGWVLVFFYCFGRFNVRFSLIKCRGGCLEGGG